jgi:hypothetical protein
MKLGLAPMTWLMVVFVTSGFVEIASRVLVDPVVGRFAPQLPPNPAWHRGPDDLAGELNAPGGWQSGPHSLH